MEITKVLALGHTKPRAKGAPAKVAYALQSSQARYALLPFVLLARASNLRAAARRYRRKIGMPLAPLPFASKYRTKGRAR